MLWDCLDLLRCPSTPAPLADLAMSETPTSSLPGHTPESERPRLLAGRYELGALIGRGGMADVHLGTDSRLGRRVAIKLLRPSLASDPKFRTLFREEAQKAARMAHPTIVRVFDAGEETIIDGAGVTRQVPYIVMEYVDGRLLKDIIEDGPLAPTEAVRITAQILTALEYSHRALLVHRDIKPGNVMITQSGQVKVMDFGIARAISDNSATVAESGSVLGTVRYFSPEQARGETVDARTDLYSTGVILFELVTGRAPFRGERAAAVAYQHISEQPATPSTINAAVSPFLDSVVLHALNKNKLDRYQTAAEFRSDLEAASAGQVPVRRNPAEELNATLFGTDRTALTPGIGLRQLTVNDDERAVRTQARPPVAWIWAGVVLVIAILFTVVVWVMDLPGQAKIEVGKSLSVIVPNVVGSSFEIGSVDLGKANLAVVKVGQASNSVPEGNIIATDPAAKIKVPVKQAVTVYVSLGKVSTTVPRLDQQTEAVAQELLRERKLAVGKSSLDYSTTVPLNMVVSSDPAAGSAVREGDPVDLIVSNGLVQVPSEVGQPFNTAITALGALLLQVDVKPDASCAGGLVTAQSLPPGDHPQKSPITITYCSK